MDVVGRSYMLITPEKLKGYFLSISCVGEN